MSGVTSDRELNAFISGPACFVGGVPVTRARNPVRSETEDKFEDAMEVTASSPLPELARVLVRFNHIASLIVNANHSII